jgi:hypothetical protein
MMSERYQPEKLCFFCAFLQNISKNKLLVILYIMVLMDLLKNFSAGPGCTYSAVLWNAHGGDTPLKRSTLSWHCKCSPTQWGLAAGGKKIKKGGCKK